MIDTEYRRLGARLLVLAPNPWLGQWVNRQQLFSRIGYEAAVLYSTGGWFNWDRQKEEWRQASAGGGFSSHDNVWVDASPKYLLRIPRLNWLDNLVLRLQARRWKKLLADKGTGPFVAFIYHPQFFPYVSLLGADYLIYHAYDLYSEAPGWTPELERDERALLRMANLVVAASEQMSEALSAKSGREVRFLPNGADVGAFERALQANGPEPADLANIPHPRLGWVGSLHPQVDYALLAELARRRPDWHVVLVGQVMAQADARAEAERADCHNLPNIHFLGGKPIHEIPGYMAKMDVHLMCYRLADEGWIKAIYPLKLHEYLATGIPVVSADVPSVRPFAEVVRIVEGVDAWQEAIDDALLRGGHGSRERRKAVAAENSWDSRVRLLKSWLVELVVAKKGGS